VDAVKVWLFSDLHLPNDAVHVRRVLPGTPDADVCVVAGDLTNGRPDDAVHWLDENIGGRMPVLYVLGNHEFYDQERSMETARGLAQRAAWHTSDRVRVLDDMGATIGGVRFLGSTLWYDLQLNGSDPDNMARAYDGASRLNDSRFLHHGTTRWSPSFARAQHLQSRAWLEAELAASDLPVVVVTHHAPHPSSIAPEYERDLSTAAFVSDLTDVIERHQPALWLHGHTHTSFDYTVGETRIVCNPRGYGRENARRFDPAMVLEIDGYEPKPHIR
jgi:Icc-related predicted phosphoesterase